MKHLFIYQIVCYICFMFALNRLREATEVFLESLKVIDHQISREIWDKAPVIVHQKFCAELVRICKEHQDKTPKQIPEAIEVMYAIDVLERLYPEVKLRP